MAIVQQIMSIDEIDVAQIGQSWLDEICRRVTPEQFPAEVTCKTIDDMTVQTLWSKGIPIAFVIRQRDVLNRCIMTTIKTDAPEQQLDGGKNAKS